VSNLLWSERLSVSQLQGIQRFASQVRGEGQRLTVARLIDHAASWNDSEAAMVVTSSAARCALS